MSAVADLLWGERPKVQRAHPEDDLQRDVVGMMRWRLPADAEFWAVPNGGKRHDKEAARMTGLGLKAGVPDITVVWRGRWFGIELKAQRGVLSEHQRQMLRKLEHCQCPVFVCRSVPEVEAALSGVGIELRGRVMA